MQDATITYMVSKKIVPVNDEYRICITHNDDAITIETQTLNTFMFFFKSWEYYSRLEIHVCAPYHGKVPRYPGRFRISTLYRSWECEEWPENLLNLDNRVQQVKDDILYEIAAHNASLKAISRAFNKI